MRALSGGTRGAAHHSSTATDGITRKTRLSFELHNAMLEDEDFLSDDQERVTEGEDSKMVSAESILASIFVGDDAQANIRTFRAA